MKILYMILMLMILCSGMMVYAQNDMMAAQMPGQQMGTPPHPCPSMDMMRQNMLPMIIQQLGLTDAQIARIQNVFLDFAKTQARIQSEAQVAQIELFQMFLNDKINRAQIEKQTQKLTNLQGQMQLEGVKAILSAQSVLTQDQWSRMVTMLRRMALSPQGPPPGAPGMMPGMMSPGSPGMNPGTPALPPAQAQPMPNMQ
ncbi:MAG: Spy/CpxP family protein refolding chaperone [Armatimonadota bacterium]